VPPASCAHDFSLCPDYYVGHVPPNERLHLPPINLEDGPQGVGDALRNVTGWPSQLSGELFVCRQLSVVLFVCSQLSGVLFVCQRLDLCPARYLCMVCVSIWLFIFIKFVFSVHFAISALSACTLCASISVSVCL